MPYENDVPTNQTEKKPCTRVFEENENKIRQKCTEKKTCERQKSSVGVTLDKLLTLKKNKEFQYVYRRGCANGSKDMTLVCAKSRYGGAKAGFSVSKKVGNSVVRNRARRRLKEAFRLCLPDISGHYSLVFVARPSIAAAEFSEILSQMRYLLKKAQVVRRTPQGR